MNQQLIRELSRITEEEQHILDGDPSIDPAIYSDSPAFVIDSGKMLQKGKLIQVRPHTRFVHFPRHTHNYVEMIYMCSGQTIHVINGSKIVLRTGELLILNQHATQEILPASAEDIAVNFIILPEFFDQTLAMLGSEPSMLRDFVTGCLQSADSPLSYLHFQVSRILPVQNLVENLVWTITHDLQNKRLMNQITMGLLFLQLLNHMDKIQTGQNSFEQELLMNVLQYVEEPYRDGSLTALSNHLNCEFTWLSKTILKLSGYTYTDLVQKKRLEQACFLLRTTALSVTDISLAVGYDNFSYFHRLFRKSVGLTPGAYRKSQGLPDSS